MDDQIRWLGAKEELDFAKQKFRGKLAGKMARYRTSLESIIRVRFMIFIMALLVFSPIVTNYFLHDVFSKELFYERIVFSVALLAAGLIYNKNRVIAIIIASIPILLIIYTYVFIPGNFDIKTVGFMMAILVFILRGLFHHFRLIKMKKELHSFLIENSLID